ncbi:hypothetical protein [Salinimicrobium xinjiangense]|uniref:hypothetical protein n=1 Tax=Salinimicrobium xinjiangense TaxID=438596 RepID=UPI0003FE2314|nr:hypothetical protein [Salinimicrobium xinjiangense]
MYSKKYSSLFLVVGVMSFYSHLFGQENSAGNKEMFIAFDMAIGEVNTAIYSGAEYIEKHRMINENHKFFQSREFVPSTVDYAGQTFFNIPLKYNVFEDLVIVNPQDRKIQNGFRLFDNQLQGFDYNGRSFVNISSAGAKTSGIHEMLFEDKNFQVLKKYRLKEKMIRKDSYVHYEFRAQKPTYFFLYKGEYRELNRRNLLQAFPDQRTIVLDNFRNFRKQSGERRDRSAVVLFQTLSQIKN